MDRALQGELPPPHPRYVVWELTLRCDLACRHCGSRAGKARPDELSVDEALEVVDQLAQAGTHEITFIGGEAYLYADWLRVVARVRERGMHATLTTGGRQFGEALARRAAEAGLEAVGVSIDGLEPAHDRLRNVKGSWRAALGALDAARKAGMTPQANTQINRVNLPDLEALADVLAERGVKGWQVQLTGPMGRAADIEDWLLQPYDLLALVPRLGAIAERLGAAGCRVEAANNLGYFGPHEGALRRGHFSGCKAGVYTLGLEANGDVKGCPSLPSAPYVGGNLRSRSLAEIWAETAALRFARDRDTSELWGFCKSCYYADTCRGGCSWTAHTLLGRRGNMPYCHHRALELETQGLRERLVKVEAAPGTPFDYGRFEIVVEPLEPAASTETAHSASTGITGAL
jgi:radical SAM protein with 4Fe4S-binding SPASM domain